MLLDAVPFMIFAAFPFLKTKKSVSVLYHIRTKRAMWTGPPMTFCRVCAKDSVTFQFKFLCRCRKVPVVLGSMAVLGSQLGSESRGIGAELLALPARGRQVSLKYKLVTCPVIVFSDSTYRATTPRASAE